MPIGLMGASYFLLLTSYFIFFAFLAWRRFHLALALLFFLLPTYLIRFHLGPLPTTMLEVMILIVFVIFLIREVGEKNIISHFSFLISKYKSLFLAASLFLLAATISVFTSVDIQAAAGEWKAFYVEPLLLFLILITVLRDEQLINHNTNYELRITNYVILPLILSGLVTSLLAIYQHFTGFLVPVAFWENGDSYRVTAWYGFPNAVGLFLAPLVPLAIYLLCQSFVRIKDKKLMCHASRVTSHVKFVSSFLFLVSAPFAALFAKSTGALIGLAAGIGLLLLLWKRTRWWSIGIGLIGLVSLISPVSPFRQELLLADRSGQIRVAMWSEAIELLRSRPILGAGLASYQERVAPYHTTVNGEGIEIFHHPHNIFLTMYANLGLLGLIGFVWILVWFYRTGFSASKKQSALSHQQSTAQSFPNFQFPISNFLLSSMTVLIIHGLVDSPYIKNDLAILFWLLPALLVANLESRASRPKSFL